jgi:membrane protease subunit (stomatin/prohibitin family)
MWRIEEAYQDLQALKIPNEDARFVLPNACETTIYMTMNLRTLAHFMNERLCTRAQWEIRKMAQEMKKAIKENQFEMQLDNLDIELIMSVCVPKCEAGKIKFCPEHENCGRYDAAKKINDFLNNYPVKELEGKWFFDGDIHHCSVCGTTYDFLFNGSNNYCPNCGTKMTMEVHE